ncbi:site-specific integrase [Glycomyces sp. A-F 0318]|uniref:tyrosine-type recombinase/integrase n=1 Tax=Glycomyces amatae TaxID=2881355 RepID=UPI001E3E8F52|nr:site-specific integrase [Glycomyces amatae]MCD0444244.1 site-specific integrase [Glycomyces amatae]
MHHVEIEPCWEVSIYAIRTLNSKRNPWQLRWRVGKLKRPPFTKSFPSEKMAVAFRDKLNNAISEGRAFDLHEGLPADMLRAKREEEAKLSAAPPLSLYDLARTFAAANWKGKAGHTRVGNADGLRDILVSVLPEPPVSPKELRLILRNWAFNPLAVLTAAPPAVTELLDWVATHSPRVRDLEDMIVMADLLESLTYCYNGKRASSRHFDKRRATLSALLKKAVIVGELDSNPLANPRLDWQRPTEFREAGTFKPQEAGTREEVESTMAAVSYTWPSGPLYVAPLATLYYGMARPEEAAGLNIHLCKLPSKGWGEFRFHKAVTQVGKLWTDDGSTHEIRALKHRPESESRTVPVPPRVVQLVTEHIDTHGTAKNGTIFRSAFGRRLSPGTMWLLCQQARKLAFGPDNWETPLLHRPYSYRVSGILLRLLAGNPEEFVAAWSGHTVAILRRWYATTVIGYEKRWLQQVDDFLGS